MFLFGCGSAALRSSAEICGEWLIPRKDGSAGLHPNPRKTGVAWEPVPATRASAVCTSIGFKKNGSKNGL